MSKKELADIKGDILDLNREMKTIIKRLDEMTIFFENHGHVDQKITGPAVFLQDVYEQKVRARQQAQQAQQPQPTPIPEEQEEPKEK